MGNSALVRNLTSGQGLPGLQITPSTVDVRLIPASAIAVGMALQLASLDSQQDPDVWTAQIPLAIINLRGIVGVVSQTFGGFDGKGGMVSPAASARGTTYAKVTTGGFHPAVLIDNTGANTSAITHNASLGSSNASAGWLCGPTTPVVGGQVAVACLPANGIGSSLGAGALAQASQTATIGGVPTAGDVYSVTIQVPFSDYLPGIAQTRTISTAPLTAGQAATTTTAAAALAAALNADPVFAAYYVATSALAVVTIKTATGLANASGGFPIFHVNYAAPWNASVVAGQMDISLSGTVGNAISFACGAVGVSTNTAGGPSLAGGTGFKGQAPANLSNGGDLG